MNSWIASQSLAKTKIPTLRIFLYSKRCGNLSLPFPRGSGKSVRSKFIRAGGPSENPGLFTRLNALFELAFGRASPAVAGSQRRREVRREIRRVFRQGRTKSPLCDIKNIASIEKTRKRENSLTKS